MQATYQVHMWLEQLIDTAVKTPCTPGGLDRTWIRSLLDHIAAMIGGPGNAGKTISIPSHSYLPGLVGATDYTFTCPRKFSYNNTDITSDFVQARAIEAVRQWLRFPHEPEIALQVGMINIITHAMEDTTLLFLTPVWEFFSDAKRIARFWGCKTYQVPRPDHKTLQLEMMQFCFARHPISDPSTPIGSSIQQLKKRVVEWTQPPKPANAQKRPPKRKNSNSKTNSSLVSPLTDQLHITSSEDYRAEFITFVRRLSIFLNNTGGWDTTLASNSQDALAKKAATDVDHYLPFRQCAPTMSSAMSTTYANIDRLQTKTGLWNIVCYRGVFFGAPWARKSLTWLDSKESWSAIHEAETTGVKKQDIETHFVKKNAS
ncbi:hypothetical protein BDN72DRAFT_907262, partial [Pluteus cervinus]